MRALKIAALMLLAAACAKKDDANTSATASSTVSSGGSVDLTGAGATFPYPLYSKWFSMYAQLKGGKIN